jgi:hypothetical protein
MVLVLFSVKCVQNDLGKLLTFTSRGFRACSRPLDLYSNNNFLAPSLIERGGEIRYEHRILVGKHEGKKPLGRPRRRNMIKWNFEEGSGGVGIGFMQGCLQRGQVGKCAPDLR